MNPAHRPFVYLLVLLMLAGMAAFLSATAGAPWWGMLMLFASLAGGCAWSLKGGLPQRVGFPALLGLLVMSGILCWNARQLSPVEGSWDAWSMWNYKAQTLAKPGGLDWLTRHAHPFDHADYPLGLPGMLAFFVRLLGPENLPRIALALHLTLACAIAAWLTIDLDQRSRPAALAAALTCCLSGAFALETAQQNADIPLAVFFTGAVLLFSDGQHRAPVALAAGGLLLGSACWIKNEGLILTAIVVLVYGAQWLKHRRWLWVLCGMALPLVLLLAYKGMVADPNDLLREPFANKLTRLKDTGRYRVIWTSLWTLLKGNYKVIAMCLLLALLMPVLRKSRPSRPTVVLVLALCAYHAVYLMTPQDLEWHLATSQNRLLMQLFPLAVWTAGREVARLLEQTTIAGKNRRVA